MKRNKNEPNNCIRVKVVNLYCECVCVFESSDWWWKRKVYIYISTLVMDQSLYIEYALEQILPDENAMLKVTNIVSNSQVETLKRITMVLCVTISNLKTQTQTKKYICSNTDLIKSNNVLDRLLLLLPNKMYDPFWSYDTHISTSN